MPAGSPAQHAPLRETGGSLRHKVAQLFLGNFSGAKIISTLVTLGTLATLGGVDLAELWAVVGIFVQAMSASTPWSETGAGPLEPGMCNVPGPRRDTGRTGNTPARSEGAASRPVRVESPRRQLPSPRCRTAPAQHTLLIGPPDRQCVAVGRTGNPNPNTPAASEPADEAPAGRDPAGSTGIRPPEILLLFAQGPARSTAPAGTGCQGDDS